MKHRWEHVTSCIAMFVMHRLLTIERHLVHKVGHLKRIVKSAFEAKHRYKISSCKDFAEIVPRTTIAHRTAEAFEAMHRHASTLL